MCYPLDIGLPVLLQLSVQKKKQTEACGDPDTKNVYLLHRALVSSAMWIEEDK